MTDRAVRIDGHDVRLIFLNRLGELDSEHARLWLTDARYHADTDAVAHMLAMVTGILMDKCKIYAPSVFHILIDELAQICVVGRQARETAKRIAQSLPVTSWPEFDKPS